MTKASIDLLNDFNPTGASARSGFQDVANNRLAASTAPYSSIMCRKRYYQSDVGWQSRLPRSLHGGIESLAQSCKHAQDRLS